MAKQTVQIHVDIDLDAYRREYGDPTLTLKDARKDVQQYVVAGTRQFLRTFDYATIQEEVE